MEKSLFENSIRNYQPQFLSETPHAAAILVICMEDEAKNLFLILTKRSSTLVTYAGDYSFPGGMRDENDLDFKATAQREVKEELNIDAEQYEIIGNLNDFLDRYGNLVKPFVAVINKKMFEEHYQKSLDEVESIYYFPLEELKKLDTNLDLEHITKRHPSYYYQNQDVMIWGLTASIMVHLSNIIFGLHRPIGTLLTDNN